MALCMYDRPHTALVPALTGPPLPAGALFTGQVGLDVRLSIREAARLLYGSGRNKAKHTAAACW